MRGQEVILYCGRSQVLWLLGLALVSPPTVKGQVFHPQAGSSTLLGGSGASLNFQGRNDQGWFGVGSVQGSPRFGGLVKFPVHHDTVGLGDDAFNFDFPTDVIGGGHSFLGRGVSLSHRQGQLSILGFAGTTSQWFTTPFLQTATSNRTVGLLFLDYGLSPKVRLFSRNVFSGNATMIDGVEWQPQRDLQMALAAGIGANQGYFSSSLSASRRWLAVKAGYVATNQQFRRVVEPASILRPEVDKENVLLTLRPKSFITLDARHENLLSPLQAKPEGSLRATLNEYSANVRLAGFNLATAQFESRVQGERSQGTSFSAGRNLGRYLGAVVSFLHSRPTRGVPTSTLTANFNENISPRLRLLQVVTHADGQNSVSFGGDFVSNRLSVSVGYQTQFLPFARGGSFEQTLDLHVTLHPFDNAHLTVETFTEPDGTTQYSVYSGTFLYRQKGLVAAPGAPTISFPKYIIRGRVVDTQGHTVAGATVGIGKNVVFTDSQGKFFLRERKRRPYLLQVLVKEFLVPGSFEVVAAPKSVIPAKQGEAAEVTITVRRAP